ncbi:lycopene cyclase domain-containing protein [Halosimplex carlsbadense 2-9-1]|uniref:Lycopene cyclase domain-containing protein n=1 Tax=Halosimplex carlsbadense 2-9-1 TaxID=797114 RepID=M0CT52_9EURY|nr:lycopene cyclase domain-containing protein [Halosimplex carlsbadense 2-9-1]
MDSDRAGRVVAATFALGVVTLWATVAGAVPPSAGLAGVVWIATALVVAAGPVDGASGRLTVGGGVGLLALAVAVFVEPLSGVALPDIGVLGPYTYLATEVVFGTFALGLLVRAGRAALRRTAVTVAVVYPLAYVWDWYTLEVGVFAIPLRTGVEFVGIPLEEHVFMVVVPALVLGLHETLHGRRESK